MPRICCLDLDTFFVSVERLLDPSLVGKPVVVGASPGHRGVVCAASYEVRAFGVRSGMPISEAVRLAPQAIFVPPRHGTYGPYAARVRAVLERWCPVVHTASIDEFFLDFSGCDSLYRRPGDPHPDATIERAVREMRECIQREVELPASVGIGTTRAIAKMASGFAKPAGVLMIRAGQEHAFVDDLPVRKFPGIGPVAEQRLVQAGIETLGQLLALGSDPRWSRFSGVADLVRLGVEGSGCGLPTRDRPAFREHDLPGDIEGSISNERTFSADVVDVDPVHDELRALVERVAWRARRRDVWARTLTLRLRYADFETLSRSLTMPPTHDEPVLLAGAHRLLESAWTRPCRIRLLGVALSNLLGPERQLALPFAPRHPPIGSAIDAVRERFGYEALRLGSTGQGRGWVA